MKAVKVVVKWSTGNQMNPVIQEEISGCGIAACAALAGITYAQAKETANALDIYAEDTALWSDTEYVRKLLRALLITAASTETPFDSWENLPDKALLAIKWRMEQGRPFWHWVVFVRYEADTFVLDSKKALKTNTRRDFGRITPKWFIDIV
jgi:ABC-type bacteriocin/lantibiotic exporter with double-glycine peptidase domain